MAETIRFAVVRWNRRTREAQAVVIDETKALTDGNAVHTVRQSLSAIQTTGARWTIDDVLELFTSKLGLGHYAIAIVEVDHAL